MVRITSLHSDKLGQMDQIKSQIENLTLSDTGTRQATGDGSTSKYARESSFSGNGESNGHRAHEDISEEDLASEARRGVHPSTNDESGNHSSDDDSDEDSSSEDEDIKAPFELLGEFLDCVRSSDWENASKLCKMILIYEPDNELALQFQPVIEEKSQIEKELAEMSSSSDDEEYSSEEASEEETESDEYESDDKEQEEDDEFEPRPGSTMKNPLIFPHNDPVWKP